MRIKLEVHIVRERDERSKFESLADAATHLYSSLFAKPREEFAGDPNGHAGMPRERPRPV